MPGIIHKGLKATWRVEYMDDKMKLNIHTNRNTDSGSFSSVSVVPKIPDKYVREDFPKEVKSFQKSSFSQKDSRAGALKDEEDSAEAADSEVNADSG
jgi:hypothetical protein